MFQAVLEGTLIADPELKEFKSGVSALVFTVSAKQNRKKRPGEQFSPSQLVRVTVFGKQTDYLHSKLVKGCRVVCLGDLDITTYTARSGETRISVDVKANSVDVTKYVDIEESAQKSFEEEVGDTTTEAPF